MKIPECRLSEAIKTAFDARPMPLNDPAYTVVELDIANDDEHGINSILATPTVPPLFANLPR